MNYTFCRKYKKYKSLTFLQKAVFSKCFFFSYLYQDNVFPDLTDTIPGNDIFTVSSPQAAELARSRHDQCCDLPAFFIEFQIHRTAKAFAGAGIYDFFLFQFTKTHKYTFFRNCSVPSQLRFFQNICRKYVKYVPAFIDIDRKNTV